MNKGELKYIPDSHTFAQEVLGFYDGDSSVDEKALLDLKSLREEVLMHHPAITETIDLSFTEPQDT